MSNTNVKGYECKHVIYTRSRDYDSEEDHVLIKVNKHLEDGTIVPEVKSVENYERDFYITSPEYRDHEQKKTAEHKDRLLRFTGVNDAGLARAVNAALKKRHQSRFTIRDANESPYVYGTDDTSPVIIKRNMRRNYLDLESAYTVCAVDIETNVTVPEWHPDRGKIIMVGATFKDKAVIAITESFLEGVADPQKKILDAMQNLTPEEMRKRNIDLKIFICKTPGECTVRTMECIHEWKPDFLSTWNMAFDAPIMLASVEEEGIDPADVFSDPIVPKKYRKAKWMEGRKVHVSASGKSKSLDWNEQWHTFDTPASYYWVDSGAVYTWVRTAKGKESSMKLDSILKKNIKMGKLHFDELTAAADGLEWHEEMQRNHKIEYCIYNLFDCVGLELLDEETTDLAYVFPILMGNSEYKNMPSEPKRLVNDFVEVYEEEGMVMAGSPRQIEVPEDAELPSLKDWITTLRCDLEDIPGYALFTDSVDHETNVYPHCADLDVTGAYPWGQIRLNISRETTKLEICRIEGVSDESRRSAGINMTAARTNAIQISVDLFKAPSPSDILDAWDLEAA